MHLLREKRTSMQGWMPNASCAAEMGGSTKNTSQEAKEQHQGWGTASCPRKPVLSSYTWSLYAMLRFTFYKLLYFAVTIYVPCFVGDWVETWVLIYKTMSTDSSSIFCAVNTVTCSEKKWGGSWIKSDTWRKVPKYSSCRRGTTILPSHQSTVSMNECLPNTTVLE